MTEAFPTNVARENPKRKRTIPKSLSVWLVLAVQVIVLFIYRRRCLDVQLLSVGTFVFYLAANIVLIAAFFRVLGLLFGRWRKLLGLFNLISITVFFALFAYHYSRGTNLHFSLVADNFQQILYQRSWSDFLSHFRLKQALMLLGGGILLAIVAFHTGPRPDRTKRRHGQVTAAISILVVLGMIGTPLCATSDMAYFLRSVVDHVVGPFRLAGSVEPLVRKAANDIPLKDQNPVAPHIFIVMMESFNGHFVDRFSPEGKEYTPVFNALSRESLSVSRFYGNSIQTPRGQVAVLASILPSIYGTIATRYKQTRLEALPKILRQRGYRTVFFQPDPDLDFDDTGLLMKRLGFEVIKAMDREFLTPEDAPFVWGWGLQDDVFYKKFFDWLDRDRAAARGNGRDVRYFATLATISHHTPFDQVPAAQRYLYPQPADKIQVFANSIHLSDRYLNAFFTELAARDYLRDSLVVVTGDHGYPAGEHGNFFNETGFYEENFRVPLAILWPHHLAPRAVRKTAYCQLDIAPTLLDLLTIRQDNPFMGRTILSGDSAPQQPVPLVQPYRGLALAVVQYPLKYVRQALGTREMIFDLVADPEERHDILSRYQNTDTLRYFRRQIDLILDNQKRIERDRLWPAVAR